MRIRFAFMLCATGVLMNVACAKQGTPEDPGSLNKSLVILYDNDVHCGDEADGYAQAAGLRNAIASSDTAYCLLVSSGDFLQGGVMGSLSEGGDMIKIINRCHYDAACLGNHEFDFKIPRLNELISECNCPITCCNLTKTGSTVPEYSRYVMVKCPDGVSKIAFVGVLTPETIEDEIYAFKDEEGNITHSANTDRIVEMVQSAVDDARAEGASYVFVLSHLGEKSTEMSSRELISKTDGIDAVLDGHTHSVIETEMVSNKNGMAIILTQTGTKFANLGKLHISTEGKISNELIPVESITYCDADVKYIVDSICTANAKTLDEVIGTSEVKLSIYGEDGERLVRKAETNVGDFVADALRYAGNSQASMINGGGVRSDIAAGDVKYKDLINITPFGNELITFKVDGNVILRLLNEGAEGAQLGLECGMFPVVSNIKFVIELDGDTRVLPEKVSIFNSSSLEWEPLELDGYYEFTTTGYYLDTYEYLGECEILDRGFGNEYEALKKYLTEGLNSHIGQEYEKAQGRITFE